MSPDVVCFFDNKTNSASYVVSDPETGHAAVIDPVLDFDSVSGRTATDSAEKIAGHVSANSLTVDWIIETHVHADHLTASVWLKEKLGGKTGIGAGIAVVRATFGKLFNAADVMDVDVTPFDQLFADGATFRIGQYRGEGDRDPGPHACLRHLCYRRFLLRRRYHVHAGFWNRAL